jgi:hypothetical protein
MSLDKQQLWKRFQDGYTDCRPLDLAVDLSRVDFPPGYFETMAPLAERAFAAMSDL